MGIISLLLGIVGFLTTVPSILAIINISNDFCYATSITIFAIGISLVSIITGITSIIQKSYRTAGIIGLSLSSVTCIIESFFLLIVYFHAWFVYLFS